MKKMKCIAAMIFSIFMMETSFGQDPSFSQFFSSPLNINPALTANINADWRVISNFRDQWIGPASPYVTGTISYDSKLLQKKTLNVSDAEDHYLGIGTMLMFDNAMSGIVRSTYGSLNLSYNIKLAGSGDTKHRFGVGFGAIYGRRYIDFSRLDFEEQFTGSGFNTNLPTGESALSNMKPYISSSAGVLYSFSTEKSNLDLGVSAFHLNRPKQTFLENQNQRLPLRKVAHANFETFINERVVLNLNAIYQYQEEAKYYSFGGALGYYLGDAAGSLINTGVWYWSNNALVPYVGLAYRNLQFGLSYDITVSKLREATMKPKTWEISIILRGIRRSSGVIPCPWK